MGRAMYQPKRNTHKKMKKKKIEKQTKNQCDVLGNHLIDNINVHDMTSFFTDLTKFTIECV